jgi:hypothetical protein
VAQRSDGVWDVVDGVQRLSTIFEFIGVLRDEDGHERPPLVLEKTRYLPALAKKMWKNDESSDDVLTQAQQLFVKRAKISVIIVLRQSSDSGKYELFQRLNSGSPLSDQEMRNCLLVMRDKSAFRWLEELANDQSFQNCISITDRALEERYDLELLLRFIVLRRMSSENLSQVGDIGDFLTESILKLPNEPIRQLEAHAFLRTFELLMEIGSNVFRKFDPNRTRFTGGFLLSAFEAVALGVGYHVEEVSAPFTNLQAKIEALWSNPNFLRYARSGVRASSRIPAIVPLGREIFKP